MRVPWLPGASRSFTLEETPSSVDSHRLDWQDDVADFALRKAHTDRPAPSAIDSI
jgi:hypothetical protein